MDSSALTRVTGRSAGPDLDKAPTGISGLDQILGGGLPRDRVTLVAGAAGAGKTLLGMNFLVAGARKYGEPGVLMAFRVDPSEIVQAGVFDFEPIFAILDDAIKQVGAKRVVLDTIEVIFGAFGNDTIVRSELIRLVRWLDDRGVTVLLTGERGSQGGS